MSWGIHHGGDNPPWPPLVRPAWRIAEPEADLDEHHGATRCPAVGPRHGGSPDRLPTVATGPRGCGGDRILREPRLLRQYGVRLRAHDPSLQCAPARGIHRLHPERELVDIISSAIMCISIPRSNRPAERIPPWPGIDQSRPGCGARPPEHVVDRHRHRRWPWSAGLPHSGGFRPPSSIDPPRSD